MVRSMLPPCNPDSLLCNGIVLEAVIVTINSLSQNSTYMDGHTTHFDTNVCAIFFVKQSCLKAHNEQFFDNLVSYCHQVKSHGS